MDEILPNGAMGNALGDLFYPNDPTEAAWIRDQDQAEFGGYCPGMEEVPNKCTCSCYGCNFHCTACWRGPQ